MPRRIALVLAIVGGAALLALLLYSVGWLHLSYPDRTRYTVRGIDVSHHQGVIDWQRVAKTRVRFAYLKASEGGDWRDESFGANLQGAKSNGLAVGAYHFFTFCAPGGVQARSFLELAPPDVTDLPPAVDLEYVGNCAARPQAGVFARELRAFLRIIEARYHATPVLYTTQTFFDVYLKDEEFARYPLWFRDLTGLAALPKKRTVLFRQFADNGSVDGVKRLVDEDLFMGSNTEFEQLLADRRPR
jgi:lysozyme